MSIRVEPCDWQLSTDSCPDWANATADQKTFATRIASELLWRLSGRRFGLCPATVRPCRSSCQQRGLAGWWPPGSDVAFYPVLSGGVWLNAVCGTCRSDCSCSALCEIALPGPVDSVTEVRVDGQLVDPALYAVHDHRILVRRDDECWPDCQDLAAAPDEPGAFAVSYVQGIEVPPGGQYAAGVYACELIKAWTGGSCRLPKRIQSLTREGVTLTFLDPMEFLDKGKTGIPEVDQWIAAVNPNRLSQPSRVYSPDLMPPRTVTWTPP